MSEVHRTHNVYMPRLKTSIVIWLSVMLFIALMSVSMIDPVADFAARLVQCPGATSTTLDSSDGGTVRSRSSTGTYTNRNTTVYTMTCTYPDGTTTIVGNDTRFMSAMGLAGAVALVLGVMIPVLLRIWARIRARFGGRGALQSTLEVSGV